MKRYCFQQLEKWRSSATRKPMLLMGARQVGKTYLLKEFASTAYQSVIYANFEEDLNLHHFFETRLSPEHVIQKLEIYFNRVIDPDNTLIIFDEIQACPRALSSLKYFYEDAKQYHIAAAGSLLGLKLTESSGFPVGKVNLIHLYPLGFMEFLLALGKEKWVAYFNAVTAENKIDEVLHTQFLEYFHLYLFVGGMPEAVFHYQSTQSILGVREIQKAILKNYELDFSRHVPSHLMQKILLIWNSIPNQLAKENKKFIFSVLRSGARAREYEAAIQWLIDAGLVYRCVNLTTPRLPLSAYEEGNAFKIYQFDVGLMGALSDLSPKLLTMNHQLFTEFKGALVENVVAQTLVYSKFERLFYWTSGNKAEIDFIFQVNNEIIPLEVKSGSAVKSKSLKVYVDKYHPATVIRSSSLNYNREENFINIPFYFLEIYLTKIISDEAAFNDSKIP